MNIYSGGSVTTTSDVQTVSMKAPQNLRTEEAKVHQVAKIIILSDKIHSSGDGDMLVGKLKEIKASKMTHFVLFNESEFIENSSNLSFSLEEWSTDSVKSFAPPLLAALVHIMMGSGAANLYLPMLLNILYKDPYFKKIVLYENFKNYNQHKLGLPVHCKATAYKMSQKETNTLVLIQKHFNDLDSLSEQDRNNLLYQRTEEICHMMCCDLETFNPALFAWISEYAAVAKTIAIQKRKSIAEKELGDFTVDTMWKIFYRVGLNESEHGQFIQTLTNETRSHFMANKLIRKVDQYSKSRALELDLPFVLCVGQGHIPTLTSRLKSYSRLPLEVINIEDIAHNSLESIARLIQKGE
jgi:hypothetical protein